MVSWYLLAKPSAARLSGLQLCFKDSPYAAGISAFLGLSSELLAYQMLCNPPLCIQPRAEGQGATPAPATKSIRSPSHSHRVEQEANIIQGF